MPDNPARCPVCSASLVVCDKCGHSWCLDHGPAGLACPGCGHRPSDDYPRVRPIIPRPDFLPPSPFFPAESFLTRTR